MNVSFQKVLLNTILLVTVVIPLRNGDYYDAMRMITDVQARLRGLLTEDGVSRHIAQLKDRVADRCIAVDFNEATNTYGCLTCHQGYRTPISYICHQCFVPQRTLVETQNALNSDKSDDKAATSSFSQRQYLQQQQQQQQHR